MASTNKKFSRRSLRLQALMMGAAYKVEIVWDPKATTASTNGKRITLPALAHSGSAEDAELLEGLFDHEVGHCRFSDFEIIGVVAKTLGATGKSLHNTLEDIYEEKMMGEVYPGCKRSLRRVEEIFIQRNMYGVDKPMDPVNALNIGVYSMLRMNVLEHPSQVIFDAIHPQMIQHFGHEITDKILLIAAKTAFAKSTRDTAAITSSILDLIKESIDESKKKNERDNRQAQDSPQDYGNPSQQSGSQSTKPEPSSQEPGQPQPGASDPQPGEAGQGGDPEPTNTLSQDQIDALQSALDAAADEIKDISVDSNAVKVLDQNGVVTKGRGGNGAGSVHDVNVVKAQRNDAWRNRSMASAQPLFAKIGTKLEALLEAIKEQNEWAASSGRKMTRDMAERHASGNFKIFRRSEEYDQINTAVSILVDYSGSMEAAFDGKDRMGAAWDACFALGKVMYQHDIPFAVTGFAGDVCHLKDFEENPNAIKPPLGNDGATMTHEGILAAGFPLLSRSEEKKLLILITDGIPSSSSDATASIMEMIGNDVNVAVVFINDSDTSGSAFARDLTAAGCSYAPARTCAELSNAVFSAVRQSMQA